MRLMGALFVAGAIAFVASILTLGSRVEAQMSAKTRGQDASSKAAAAAATCHHLIPVTAIRVAVTFAKAGIGPGRTQSTLGAVSIKAPIKATAFETMVAETSMARMYGPALRCSVAAETAVVRLDPGDSEGVVVRRDPMACETGAAKTANMASAAKTKTTDVASAAKTKTTDVASAAQATDMTSAAQATDMTSAAKATAPCERDCAGRCCSYAEHDGRTCCNQLVTHFSELLMFTPRRLEEPDANNQFHGIERLVWPAVGQHIETQF